MAARPVDDKPSDTLVAGLWRRALDGEFDSPPSPPHCTRVRLHSRYGRQHARACRSPPTPRGPDLRPRRNPRGHGPGTDRCVAAGPRRGRVPRLARAAGAAHRRRREATCATGCGGGREANRRPYGRGDRPNLRRDIRTTEPVPQPTARSPRAGRCARTAPDPMGNRDFQPEGAGCSVGRGSGPVERAEHRRWQPRRARQAGAGSPAPRRPATRGRPR